MKSKLVHRALCACALAGFALCATAQQAPVSAEKQKLVQKVLSLWHAEEAAIVMVQRPAARALEQSNIALQGRVSAQKQEATMKDIAHDVQKYIDEATPIARDNAQRLKEPTLGPLLSANFSEDELRQLVVLLESPVKKKFEQLLPGFERAYGEQVAAVGHAAIDPKLQALTQTVGTKLRAAAVAP